MTVNSTEAVPVDRRLFTDLVAILAAVCSEGSEWASTITPGARLEGDLRMESIELAALAEALHQRYGDPVDLEAFCAGLEIDQLIELTVADVLEYLAACRPPNHAAERASQ